MRTARLIVFAVMLAACSGGPAATPIVIYVTPAPPTATAIPDPTPAPPTRAARPTYTADDQKIDDQIRDGEATMLDQTHRMGDPNEDTIAVMREARDFAENQLLLLNVYQPSICTQTAVTAWRHAMEDWQFTAQAFLDWIAAGAVGDPDSKAEETGQYAGQAQNALDASC